MNFFCSASYIFTHYVVSLQEELQSDTPYWWQCKPDQ